MKKYIHAGGVGLFIIYFISIFSLFAQTASAIMIAPTFCCSNVAFIPGLEGSRLYAEGLMFENQLWEPNRNDDVRKLYLDDNGQSIRTDIYTKDIIDESNIGGLNIYKTFEESMDDLVSRGVIMEWKAFPYDWRKDISDVVIGGSNVINEDGDFDILNFADEIERMAVFSMSGKVTIIAHSNGGLITKLLVQELQNRGNADLVDKVILVAVPELGTPKAIPALLHGYDQGFAFGLILLESVARGLGRNMQSAFNLLPSKEYFDRTDDPVVIFDSSIGSLSDLLKNGSEIDSFDELQSFLSGNGDGREDPGFYDKFSPAVLGQNFLQRSEDTHAMLDVWQFPENIEVSQVAGWGLDTISATKYVVKKICGMNTEICLDVLDEQPVFTKDGDNTVVTLSATAAIAPNLKTYYLDLPKHNKQLVGFRRNRGHADILEVEELQQLIENIVSENDVLPDTITLVKPKSDPQEASVHISVHSPVSVDVYDAEGNHTGLVANPDPNSDISLVEENIPNSFYLNFGEGKYVGISGEIDANVQLQGLDYGTFTLKIDNFIDGVATSNEFTDILVTPLTVARVDSVVSASPQLVVDEDGDGEDDYIVDSVVVDLGHGFDLVSCLQSMRQTVMSFNLKKTVEKNLLAKIDKLENLIAKGKIMKVESKIEKFISKIQNKRAKNINENDKDQFVAMLDQLLDNIK